MISIDSDILRSITASANSAVEEISSGVEKMHSVTTHDDWNCAERDAINDKVTAARTSVKVLFERTQLYLDVIRRTADRFDSVDYSITQSFQNVHDSLGASLSVNTPIANIPGTTTKSVVKSILTKQNWIDRIYYGTINNMDKPISICNYSDVDFSKLSGGEN